MGLFERRVYIMYLPNCCIVIEKVENVESDIEYHSQIRKTKSDATLCQKKRTAPRSAHQPITQMYLIKDATEYFKVIIGRY